MFQGLTNKGKEYMAKCLAENKPVLFTKAKIGDGNIALEENPEDFIEIKSLKKEVNITEKVQNKDAVKLTIQFENTGVLDGYFLREIGIYVEDEGQEILYWYINDGSESSWLPPAAKSPVNFKFFINLMATNLESIIVNWTGKELWVDKEFLNKELDKIENEIKGIDEKFKNFCPFVIGQVIELANTTNPATLWLGTTWQEITDAFTKSVSSNENVGQYAGSHTVTLTKDNLPAASLKINSFSMSINPHKHKIYGYAFGEIPNKYGINDNRTDGAFQTGPTNCNAMDKVCETAGGGNTGTASPVTENMGTGKAIDIKPRHYLVKKWQRLT